MPQIAINPSLTSVAGGTFDTDTQGFIQGTALNDPAVRYALAGGIVDSAQTYPMWGGIGISEDVPYNTFSASRASGVLGSIIKRATALTGATGLTGFSVFDQDHSMLTSPQSPVPLAPQGGSVHFYRLGSGARIAVNADPALVSLEGGVINPNVSWDFVAQRLVPYIGTLTISSGTYNNTTGEIVLTMSAPVAFSAGDGVVLSSLTGTGAYASLNGSYITTYASGSTVKMLAAAGIGTSAITGGSLTLGSGASSALNVRVLDIQVGNSMVVSYAPSTGFATWDRSGTTAIILI